MNTTMGSIRTVLAGDLHVAYVEFGPAGGDPVVLLHGFPYDIHSYERVAPLLAESGKRVIVPWLRGHGETRFADATTPRSGQQAALGADVLALLDALRIPRAVLAGYDWGGRAAGVAAALWPHRVAGLVTVNGYLIQDIAASVNPIRPELEAGFWYFWYFSTERGRRGLEANRREIARVLWRRNSPEWAFASETLERSAASFANADWVELVIHSYRHRLGLAAGDPRYDHLEARLATVPPIAVPTITLDGEADGNFPATDGSAYATHFTGAFEHRRVPAAGHNLPQEVPDAFATAVLDVTHL